MAASTAPSGGHSNGNKGNAKKGNCGSGGGKENSNRGTAKTGGGGIPATENSDVEPAQTSLRHNPGISLDWTSEEQSMLEDLLSKHASEANIVRYAKIARVLQDKTVRDVALRCRWMNKKENSKRRKDDQNTTKRMKDKKEKVADVFPKSSQAANSSDDPPYVSSMISMDSDDGISYKTIGGASGQLLEENAQALDQISANFAAFKLHDNINLFCQARINILSMLNDVGEVPEIMKQMPPLPVKLNEELACTILPQTALPK